MNEDLLVVLDLSVQKCHGSGDVGYRSIWPVLPLEMLDNDAFGTSATELDRIVDEVRVGVRAFVLKKMTIK